MSDNSELDLDPCTRYCAILVSYLFNIIEAVNDNNAMTFQCRLCHLALLAKEPVTEIFI
jgi:hypothetical protein